jgi:hypothetical protein
VKAKQHQRHIRKLNARAINKETRCLKDQARVLARRTQYGALDREETLSKVEDELVDDNFFSSARAKE